MDVLKCIDCKKEIKAGEGVVDKIFCACGGMFLIAQKEPVDEVPCSDGLALSLENIIKTMNDSLDNISEDHRHIKPIVQCAAALIETAFKVEIHRLRQKG